MALEQVTEESYDVRGQATLELSVPGLKEAILRPYCTSKFSHKCALNVAPAFLSVTISVRGHTLRFSEKIFREEIPLGQKKTFYKSI